MLVPTQFSSIELSLCSFLANLVAEAFVSRCQTCRRWIGRTAGRNVSARSLGSFEFILAASLLS